MLLSRDAILAAQDLQREQVDVPEWGGAVLVSAMTGAQRDAWEQAIAGGPGGKVDLANVRARLVAACLVDEGGTPLFSAADLAALGAKSAAALERCVKVAQRLNRLTDDALEQARGN